MTSRWHLSMRRAGGFAALAGAALALGACTSMGVGSGSLKPDNTPVAFSWTSKDGGTTGTMTATAGTAGVFSGPFVQVTSSVRTEVLEPMWRGWRRGWDDWRYFGPYPATAFSTIYSGKVIANLAGPDAQPLRCRFHLNDPAAGMKSGGQGECQFNGGRTVDAVFPRA
jgi:hypothetical protein